MFDRSNLIVVAVAVLGAVLGLLAGGFYRQAPEIAAPPGVSVLRKGRHARRSRHLPISRASRAASANGMQPARARQLLGHVVRPVPRRNASAATIPGRFMPTKACKLVGIAIDDAEAVRGFLKENPVRYPILLDVANGVDPSVIFGDTRQVLPFSVLIGRDGRIVDQRCRIVFPDFAGRLAAAACKR